MISEVVNKKDEMEEIKCLFEKTQSNIRRIQDYGGEFYYPVLNEWRYVTEYAIHALVSPSERELAISELRERLLKAYNDSCLILADCCLAVLLPKVKALKKIAVFRVELRDRVVEAVERLRLVRKMRMELFDLGLADRKEAVELVEAIAALRPVFELVIETEDLIRIELRRRLIFRVTFFLCGVLELIAVIVFLAWFLGR